MPEPYSTIIISKPIHKELKKIAIDEEKPLYHITEEIFHKFIKEKGVNSSGNKRKKHL